MPIDYTHEHTSRQIMRADAVKTPINPDSGGSISATDGTTTVDPATSILFPGDNLSDGGGGVAVFAADGALSIATLAVSPATDEAAVQITGPAANVAPMLMVKRDAGADTVFKVDGNGSTFITAPGGVDINVRANDSVDITVGGNQSIYVDATTMAFFGANGAGQSDAITDATDAATTMARLNTLLAYLRSLGLIAS